MSEPRLCEYCKGNGVSKIPGGIEICSRCGGSCWEPPSTPDPSVPLSAIRALVQQWREKADDVTRLIPPPTPMRYAIAGELRTCADELAALCPAPPEDQK